MRTLTLNVYAIPDPAVQAFVCAPPASSYFADVAAFMAGQAQVRCWLQSKPATAAALLKLL